jgi:hypothetical protein
MNNQTFLNKFNCGNHQMHSTLSGGNDLDQAFIE